MNPSFPRSLSSLWQEAENCAVIFCVEFAANLKKQVPFLCRELLHRSIKFDISIKSFVTWTKQMSTCFTAMHNAVCLYTYLSLSSCPSEKRRGCKWLFISVSIITIYILFWHHWHGQHARYSPKHIDLPTRSRSLSALRVLVMRCASVWFVCCPSLFAQLQDSGVIVLRQLFQVVLGPTVS